LGLSAGLAVPIANISGLNWRWSIGIWAVFSFIAFIVGEITNPRELEYSTELSGYFKCISRDIGRVSG
jgi:cyanate permease